MIKIEMMVLKILVVISYELNNGLGRTPQMCINILIIINFN